ncbi:MAG: hypothetical protein E6R13_08260 [Spirochaetes bacterium]|nr:MAG: hypothetical protein E6R13_08260 [Spirochaetota bacterium]
MAKKTTKKQAPAAGITLAQLKKEVTKNYKSSKVERFLFKLTKDCYNTEMSSPAGFGAQDLKQPYFDLYTYLLNKHKTNLVVKLINMSNKEIELWVKE